MSKMIPVVIKKIHGEKSKAKTKQNQKILTRSMSENLIKTVDKVHCTLRLWVHLGTFLVTFVLHKCTSCHLHARIS